MPGVRSALALTGTYVGLMVLLPLAAVVASASADGWRVFAASALTSRAIAAYQLSIGASFVAAAVNAVFGVLTAWMLVRYDFPGRKIVDGLVDLPLAIPTAVAGIALTTLYADSGWIGSVTSRFGVHVAFTRVGVVLALAFVGFPFVVRTVQPVLRELAHGTQEAAAVLGAGRWQLARRILLPTVAPAALAGFTLAFARAIGEYGSVVFVSGNLPGRTEVTPLLIMTRLERFDYTGAAAIAVVMLTLSFTLLLVINSVRLRTTRWSA
jgi:sulfate transport system permease protein